MNKTLRTWMRWMRRRFSRKHWMARLLQLHPAPSPQTAAGLIIIQIDGLSRHQFEQASKHGQLPFLRSLVGNHQVELHSFYSGIPSTTPAVQAEIFFGVKTAVPSFEFMQRSSGRIFRMYHPAAVAAVEAQLHATSGGPLLAGGHSYANIYRAGANGSWYCGQDLDPVLMLRRLHPLRTMILAIAYLPTALRLIGLTLLEVILAIFDMLRGILERNLLRELLFIPARISVCLVVREMVRFRVLLDIAAGTRVMHANFLGYDEQAHRRGPNSAFAHWSLKGIDRAVRDIHRAAQHSATRPYEILVYSDHGQESSLALEKKIHQPFAALMQQVLLRESLAPYEIHLPRAPNTLAPTLTHWQATLGIRPKPPPPIAGANISQQIVITALGPLGHVYLPIVLEEPELRRRAAELVAAGVPLVLIKPRSADDFIIAINRRGTWRLPQDATELLGAGHPFLKQAGEDFVRLCRHPDAGDLVLSGWDREDLPVSFVFENGAHGGPGSDETHGFLLMSRPIARLRPRSHLALRGVDIHRMAQEFLTDKRPLA